MDSEFLKVVCIDENDPLEYRVLEDSNHSDLDSVHKFVTQNFEKHKGAKWILLQCSCKM